MHITVLLGGPSAEREVSLVSGKAVADALRAGGHDVFESDIHPGDLSGLDHPCDVVFPVLHGQFGESGELQEILEARGLPFVGSGSHASRIGMNKVATKELWQSVGLPTPAWQVVSRGDPIVIDAPWVVKAIGGGSSIDVYLCKTNDDAKIACEKVLAKYQQALVERYIDGAELTVGILEERALAPIKITTSHAFFDFSAKYVGNDARHEFNVGLPEAIVRQVQELALRAHQAVGCRDLSRVDVMLDRDNQPFLLEINTLPGFTPKSLLPEAAAHAGVDFVTLVDRLAHRALEHASIGSPSRRTAIA